MLSSAYSGPQRVSPKTICYRYTVLFSMIAPIILIIFFPAVEGAAPGSTSPGSLTLSEETVGCGGG